MTTADDLTASERMEALKTARAQANAQAVPGLSAEAVAYLNRLFDLSPGHAPGCNPLRCACVPHDPPVGFEPRGGQWLDAACGQLDAVLLHIEADRIRNSVKHQQYTPEPGFRLQVLREAILLMASGHIGGGPFWQKLVRSLKMRGDTFQVVEQALRELEGVEAPQALRYPHGPKHPRKAFATAGAPGTICDGSRCGGRVEADTERMRAVFESEYRVHAALDAVYAVARRGNQVGRAVMEVDGKSASVFGSLIAATGYAKLGRQPKSEAVHSLATLLRGQSWQEAEDGDHRLELLPVRATPWQGGYLIDLGNDGRYAHVTSKRWDLIDWSEDLPVMLASPRALPIPVRPIGPDPRLQHLGFADDDPNWHQIRMWQATAFFADHERQLMLLTGGSGSGKSKRAESIAWIVDPLDTDSHGDPVMGGPLPDDEDLAPQLARNYLFTSDNLSTLKSEDSDRLCRIATGYRYTRRVLFTTSDLYTVVVKRPGLLTGIDVPPQLREDAQNRMLHIELDANAPKRPSGDIAHERHTLGSAMLGAMLNDMVTVLAAFERGEYDATDRFPIVACAAQAFGEEYIATRKNRQKDLARNRAEGDNLLQAVAKMVKHAGMEVAAEGDNPAYRTLYLSANEWVEALNVTLVGGERGAPGGWVTSGIGFGSRLGNNRETVKALGLAVVKHNDGSKRYTEVQYRPGTENLEIPEPPVQSDSASEGFYGPPELKVVGPFVGRHAGTTWERVRTNTAARLGQQKE